MGDDATHNARGCYNTVWQTFSILFFSKEISIKKSSIIIFDRHTRTTRVHMYTHTHTHTTYKLKPNKKNNLMITLHIYNNFFFHNWSKSFTKFTTLWFFQK